MYNMFKYNGFVLGGSTMTFFRAQQNEKEMGKTLVKKRFYEEFMRVHGQKSNDPETLKISKLLIEEIRKEHFRVMPYGVPKSDKPLEVKPLEETLKNIHGDLSKKLDEFIKLIEEPLKNIAPVFSKKPDEFIKSIKNYITAPETQAETNIITPKFCG